MTEDALGRWVEGYRRAWESNDRADIEALFAPDAAYHPSPYGPPWRGPEIVDGWLAHRDEPGDTTFTWAPLVVTDDVAVITATTAYLNRGQVFSNLWVIRLDGSGRCVEFTDWWMQQPAAG